LRRRGLFWGFGHNEILDLKETGVSGKIGKIADGRWKMGKLEEEWR